MIALARLLVVKPEVVVLDEASSSLDFKTEKIVVQALDLLLKNELITNQPHFADARQTVYGV